MNAGTLSKVRTWAGAKRLVCAIIRRGHIEPSIAFLCLNLLLSGGTLIVAGEGPILPCPRLFGAAHLGIAGIGIAGLVLRDHRLRAIFGFLGLFLRLWMAARYALYDWHNPAWCSFVLGALAYSWIAARSACRHVWVETTKPA